MKAKKRHLDFYRKYVEDGNLPKAGLCNCAKNNKYINKKLFDLMSPTMYEVGTKISRLCRQNGDPLNKYPWGYDGEKAMYYDMPAYSSDSIVHTFSPLRQNIVLFMAAMNGEL